jgi:outer membrane biosynthesis protein TonB
MDALRRREVVRILVARTCSLAVLLALAAACAADEGNEGPPAACQPRLQAFFASDFADQPYQQKAYAKVAATWKRPSVLPKAGAKAVVVTTISSDGSTAPPMLHMKSGSEPWDAAALLAVKAASPFDPLPKSYPRASVEVHFHFECARPSAS